MTALEASEVAAVPGAGLRGRVGGEEALLGCRALMDGQGVYLGALSGSAEELESAGHTVSFLASGGNALGLFAFVDPLKPGAQHTVERIRQMGLAACLISGDSATAARSVGAAAGIPPEMVLSEIKPEERPMQIRALRERHGAVAMVGDGLTDGPALAEADVGMAIGCGAQVDIESAQVVLVGDDLRGVLRALRIARRAVRTMRASLLWALLFNAAALPLAALGLLPPAYAAPAMVLAALAVAASSYRLSLRPGKLFG